MIFTQTTTLDGNSSAQNIVAVSQTISTSKPEYSYRSYVYACTAEMSNGYDIQKHVEKLIKSNNDGATLFSYSFVLLIVLSFKVIFVM